MRWLMLAVPAILFIGFIPFSLVMSEIFDTGLFFFITMVLYVVLFPLSPVIVGAVLYGRGGHLPIDEEGEPEVAEWWRPDMTENDGYQ